MTQSSTGVNSSSVNGSRPKKSPTKTPDRVPAHGGGKLLTGNPGNKGGTGRPADRVRAAMLADLEAARPKLLAIVNDPASKPADIINAIDKLAKYGMPAQVEVGENPSAPMLTHAERVAALKRTLKL